MKKLLPAAAFLFLCSFLVISWKRAPDREARAAATQQGLEARVIALEADLAAEKLRAAETRALLEQTVTYLDAQAQAAKTLVAVLDEADSLGFTPGMNYRSREVLLAGWRTYWGGAQQGVPKLPAPNKAAPTGAQPRQ